MNTSIKVKEAIDEIITSMMDRVMNNVLFNDPDVMEKHYSQRPLYAALVPDEIFKVSHFERHFIKLFGYVWEKLAMVASQAVFDRALQGHSISGQISTERLRRIQEILNTLEHPKKGCLRVTPNWDNELKYILEGSGKLLPTTVVADIYVEKNGVKYAIELKAPLPNSDQTKVSKEKILKLYCMVEKPITDAFYALPYNPYGRREDYNWDFPARWFDMKADKVVLIGDEFWDFIGGKGTYQLFIEEINKLGIEYKDRIYREYLGIDNQDRKGFELQ